MVDEAAHLRFIAKFVSPVAAYSHFANVLAAGPRSGAQYRSSYIQRMQKTLTQMNIQLANVISDIRRSSRCTVRTPFPKYWAISFPPLRNYGGSAFTGRRFFIAGTLLLTDQLREILALKTAAQ